MIGPGVNNVIAYAQTVGQSAPDRSSRPAGGIAYTRDFAAGLEFENCLRRSTRRTPPAETSAGSETDLALAPEAQPAMHTPTNHTAPRSKPEPRLPRIGRRAGRSTPLHLHARLGP